MHRTAPFVIAAAIAFSPAFTTRSLASQPVYTYRPQDVVPRAGAVLVQDYVPNSNASSGSAIGNVYQPTSVDPYQQVSRATRFSADGTLFDLATPDGSSTTATYAYNASPNGNAAGSYQLTMASPVLPIRWNRQGNATPLAGYGGAFAAGIAYDVNDAGTAVGYATQPGVSGGTRPTRWDAGAATPTALDVVHTTSRGGFGGAAIAVNPSGAAVGYDTLYGANDASLGSRPIRWVAGSTSAIGLDGYSDGSSTPIDTRPVAINAGGTAIGVTKAQNASFYVSVRWDAGATTATVLGGIGTDAGGHPYTRATDINDAGTVVGSFNQYDDAHVRIGLFAGRWDVDTSTAIPLPVVNANRTVSGANAINSAGMIVGFEGVAGVPESNAILWRPDGTALDLNTMIDPASGYHLTRGWSITADGWVSGTATFDPDGAGPTLSVPTNFLMQVPEPTSLVGGSAIAVLVARRTRRRA